jgi:hypothetical protein
VRRLGLVAKRTMREFGVRCLTKVEERSGREIAALREREGISQAVLARAQRDDELREPNGAGGGSALKPLSPLKSEGLDAVYKRGKL